MLGLSGALAGIAATTLTLTLSLSLTLSLMLTLSPTPSLSPTSNLAGIAATTVTNPIDVIKTRAQCFETPQSLHAVLRGVLREAGWRGLYSGFLPRLLAAVPRSVCTVLAYERAIAFCKRDKT